MTDAPILVIEDNRKSRKLAMDLLEYGGYSAIGASTAASGLRMVRQHQPRAIIMDIWLPDFDGLQLMQVLRGNRATRRIPVIAITALSADYERDELEAAGFAAFLPKPIQVEGFLGTVSDIVGDPLIENGTA